MKWQYNTLYEGKKLSYTLTIDKRSAHVRYNKKEYRFNNLNPLTFSDDILSLLKFALKSEE